jgi:hypothetical protein
MPTIPLFVTPSDPDAFHQVDSPGGYEIWHFDCGGLVIIFARGSATDPEYRRQYERYVKRPTRYPPPRPYDFSRVEVHGGTGKVVAQIPCKDIDVSDDGARVRMGDHSFLRESDGVVRVQTSGGELIFRPVQRRAPQELSQADGAAQHRCVAADVRYRVEGMVQSEEGFTYHTWGTAPPPDRIVRERDEWLLRLRRGGGGGVADRS